MPSGYGCPPGSNTEQLLTKLGRHGQRPAHIHFFVTAPGCRQLTTQINIDGDKYQSEDILEIVKVSPKAAYVRTHLEFFNGHVCNIHGVADLEDGALVYHAREKNVQGDLCVLSVRLVRGRVTLEDQEGHCAIGTCGNRGMYNRTTFDLKQRRPIRDMKVLLDSDQYKEAVGEHDGKPRP